MSAQVLRTFETRRKLKELAEVRERFQAVADAGGLYAPIAKQWVCMLTVIDEQAMNAIRCLERAGAE